MHITRRIGCKGNRWNRPNRDMDNVNQEQHNHSSNRRQKPVNNNDISKNGFNKFQRNLSHDQRIRLIFQHLNRQQSTFCSLYWPN